MTTPAGLGEAGARLWEAAVAGLPEGMEFGRHELALLDLAAHQADDLAALETSIEVNGAMVSGSAGQPVLNPAIQEARQARQAIARIVRQLGIPDEAKPQRTPSEHARHAATARWDRAHPARQDRRA